METHILLIDDDVDESEIFTNALREAGLAIICSWANCADEGFRMLEKIQPDIIVLDFNMPKINGLEMLRLLKKHVRLRNIPVVMYSATMDQDLTTKAMQQGALGCIRKPFNMQELPSLLQPFLRNTFL